MEAYVETLDDEDREVDWSLDSVSQVSPGEPYIQSHRLTEPVQVHLLVSIREQLPLCS